MYKGGRTPPYRGKVVVLTCIKTTVSKTLATGGLQVKAFPGKLASL